MRTTTTTTTEARSSRSRSVLVCCGMTLLPYEPNVHYAPRARRAAMAAAAAAARASSSSSSATVSRSASSRLVRVSRCCGASEAGASSFTSSRLRRRPFRRGSNCGGAAASRPLRRPAAAAEANGEEPPFFASWWAAATDRGAARRPPSIASDDDTSTAPSIDSGKRLDHPPSRPIVAVAHPRDLQWNTDLTRKRVRRAHDAPVVLLGHIPVRPPPGIQLGVALLRGPFGGILVAVDVAREQPTRAQLGPPRAKVLQQRCLSVQCINVEPVEGPIGEARGGLVG